MVALKCTCTHMHTELVQLIAVHAVTSTLYLSFKMTSTPVARTKPTYHTKVLEQQVHDNQLNNLVIVHTAICSPQYLSGWSFVRVPLLQCVITFTSCMICMSFSCKTGQKFIVRYHFGTSSEACIGLSINKAYTPTED